MAETKDRLSAPDLCGQHVYAALHAWPLPKPLEKSLWKSLNKPTHPFENMMQ